MNCFYCDNEVREPWEFQRDHFPIPRRCGGRKTVIACNRCHHRKDRASDWERFDSFDADLQKARGWLVSLQNDFIAALWDDQPDIAARVLLRIWPALPLSFRLVDARCLANSYDSAVFGDIPRWGWDSLVPRRVHNPQVKSSTSNSDPLTP